MTNATRLAIVVGAGPGLGMALLRRFQEGGYKTIGFVRSKVDRQSNPEGFELVNLILPILNALLLQCKC